MGLAILLLAAIPAYLIAGVAFFLGAGWLALLAIVAGCGTVFALGIGLIVHHRNEPHRWRPTRAEDAATAAAHHAGRRGTRVECAGQVRARPVCDPDTGRGPR